MLSSRDGLGPKFKVVKYAKKSQIKKNVRHASLGNTQRKRNWLAVLKKILKFKIVA